MGTFLKNPLTELPNKTKPSLILFIQAAVFVGAFVFLYLDTLIHTYRFWRSADGSHGPLILLVSLYLIWTSREELFRLNKHPAIFSGCLLSSIGFFIFFAGKLSNTMLIQQVSMIPVLLGMVLLFGGWGWFKVLLLPIGYLVFLTGLIENLLSSIVIYFQLVSAWLSAKMLSLIGMPLVLTDTIVALPHITLEVVRSCSGISHIVSLMALSIPLGIMSRLTPLRKVFLTIASFFIGLFANGVRIASIGVYSVYNEGADLHGPNETLYVTFIFFFGMVLLIVLSQLMSRKSVPTSTVAVNSHAEKNEDSEPIAKNSVSHKFYVPWLVAAVLYLSTVGFVHFYYISPVPPANPSRVFPEHIGGFAGGELSTMDQRLRPFEAHDEVLRTYKDAKGRSVELYIGYFELQDRSRKIVDYRRDWLHNEAQKLSITTTNGRVDINKTRLRDSFNPADIYFWYIMDDRIITSQYVGKFYTFLDGLLKRRTNGAVVVVQTSSSQEDVMPFLKELVPVVKKFVRNEEGRM